MADMHERDVAETALKEHWPLASGARCRCKFTAPTESLLRQHIAQEIVLSLDDVGLLVPLEPLAKSSER